MDTDAGVPNHTVAGVADDPDVVVRFDAVERLAHWANAALFLVLMATAAALYLPAAARLIGRRELVKTIHVWSGLALPVPLVLAYIGPWGRGFRADVARLDRWDPADRRWLRSAGHDPGARLGKFNPGQKLNAAFVLGAIFLVLITGSIMRWPNPFPLSWRQGATFVHDWTAFAVVIVVAGHIGMALARPATLRAMVTGSVPRRWAASHAPRWLAEVDAEAAARPAAGQTPSGRLEASQPSSSSAMRKA